MILKQDEAGYILAKRIHDAKRVESRKLVYVHDKAFGLQAQGRSLPRSRRLPVKRAK